MERSIAYVINDVLSHRFRQEEKLSICNLKKFSTNYFIINNL